jgi:hypothetical protein
MQRRQYLLSACFALLLPNVHLFAQNQPPAYLKEYQSKGLPPLGPTVEFEDKTAFPPQIKGSKQTETKLDYQARPTPPTPLAVRAVRDVALGNAQVKRALGERFAYLGTESIDAPAPTERSATTTAPTTVMRYYSYSRNRAIDVYLSDEKVVEVRPRQPGYQPAETHDEVADAAAIVRADKRYRSVVADLPARGLVTPSTTGHRHLYILFYKEEDVPPPVFRATVDMTTRRVVSARAIRRQP